MVMLVCVGLCWVVYGYVGLCRAMWCCVWLCRPVYGHIVLCTAM